MVYNQYTLSLCERVTVVVTLFVGFLLDKKVVPIYYLPTYRSIIESEILNKRKNCILCNIVFFIVS